MYGLIHAALRDLILEDHGMETWNQVVLQSGVPSNSFLTMRSYSDNTTMALVDAASQVLMLPANECLKVFGHYWVSRFAPKEYGRLLDHTGGSLIEFFQNLDALHDRLSTSFTEFKPPSFKVKINTANSAVIRYVSSREGLTPFVIGIIAGIGERFDTAIHIDAIDTSNSDQGEVSDIVISMASNG